VETKAWADAKATHRKCRVDTAGLHPGHGEQATRRGDLPVEDGPLAGRLQWTKSRPTAKCRTRP